MFGSDADRPRFVYSSILTDRRRFSEFRYIFNILFEKLFNMLCCE